MFAGNCCRMAAVCSVVSALVVSMLNTSISLLEQPVQPRGQDCVRCAYDVVVVGGGSAGCVLAARLTEDPSLSVLLLEAGSEQPPETLVPGWSEYLPSSSLDWGWRSRPQSRGTCRKGCAAIRGKGLGGSSAINGMLYVRGSPGDYDGWGQPGWSYEEVLPFFKRSEDNRDPPVANDTHSHATGGPLSVQWELHQDPTQPILATALEEVGFPHKVDFNGGDQLGQGAYQTTVRGAKRDSTNSAFLAPVRADRPNLRVITRAFVTRILFNVKKQAVGVMYVDQHGQEREVRARKEVILSAGTYGSAQLLLLSGVGPAEQLKRHGIPIITNLPGVGQNLQDHVLTFGVSFMLNSTATEDKSVEQRVIDILDYQERKRGPLTATGLSHFGAFRRSPLQAEDDPRPHLQYVFSGSSAKADCQGDGGSTIYYSILSAMPTLLHPRSRGQVQLADANPWTQPIIDFHALEDAYDAEVLAEGLRYIQVLANTTAFLDAGIRLLPTSVPDACQHLVKESDSVDEGEDGDALWRCVAEESGMTVYHGVGTCSLGTVVSPRLEVHGVRGLRVADASVIPLLPSGNTNAPTIMVAERAASMVHEDWGRGRAGASRA